MKVELVLGIISLRLDNMNYLIYTTDSDRLPSCELGEPSNPIYNDLCSLLASQVKINTDDSKFDLIDVKRDGDTVKLYYGIAIPNSLQLKTGKWNSIESIILGDNNEFSKLVQLISQKTKFYRY